ncbi:MAG: TonB family protein [Hymenobacter sp.]|nr:MAG: TonB family protein [Hymenobacter sp.]
MTKLLLPALLSLGSLSALGQAPKQDATRDDVPAETTYVDAKGKKLPSAEGADHRVETFYIDSLRGVVRVYYPSGKLRSDTPYLNIRRHIQHGRSLAYYESGQLHSQREMVANKPAGDFLLYYPDGKLRRREHYEAGQRTVAECFGPDGQPVAFYEYEQMPKYPTGDGDLKAVVLAIQQNIKYPAEALRHHLTGTIKVRFVVDASGSVREAHVVGGVDETKFNGSTLEAVRQMEAEVLQGVQKLARFQPGQHDGQPVAVTFTAPISFKIQ